MATSDRNTPTPIDIAPKRVTKNVNPLIGSSPPDTLSACADYVSFLQSYVMDSEDLKNCPTAAGGFFCESQRKKEARQVAGFSN